MATFSQSNRKLREIFNKIKSNKSALDNQRNEQLLLNFFKTTIKSHIAITDTGWIAKAPDDNDLKTINKGDLLPESLSITYTEELEIPDFFLPYIDVQVLIKTPPDSILTSYEKYSVENYTGNHVTIKGDGANIYTGPYPFANISDDDLGILVPSANTKKSWQVRVLHTNPSTGDKYSTTGDLHRIRTDENTQTCDAITIKDIFQCFPFQAPVEFVYHKILAFNESGFTGIGVFHDWTFDTGSPDCDTSVITTEEVTATKSFGAVDEYFLTLDGLQTNITQNTQTGPFEHQVTGSHITSYEYINYTNNVPYYSSLTQKQITIAGANFREDLLSQEQIDSGDIFLLYLPSEADGDTLPYGGITLDRNLGNLSSLLNTFIFEDIFLQSRKDFLVNGNPIRKDIAFFKIQDGNVNHFPSYYMKVGIGATILAPAIVDDPNPHIPTQQDIYSSGGTYTRSSNIDGLTSEAFITEKQDVQYRLMIVVRNPFWYQEVRKYESS